jgi:hypothetical protein
MPGRSMGVLLSSPARHIAKLACLMSSERAVAEPDDWLPSYLRTAVAGIGAAQKSARATAAEAVACELYELSRRDPTLWDRALAALRQRPSGAACGLVIAGALVTNGDRSRMLHGAADGLRWDGADRAWHDDIGAAAATGRAVYIDGAGGRRSWLIEFDNRAQRYSTMVEADRGREMLLWVGMFPSLDEVARTTREPLQQSSLAHAMAETQRCLQLPATPDESASTAPLTPFVAYRLRRLHDARPLRVVRD